MSAKTGPTLQQGQACATYALGVAYLHLEVQR